MHTVAQAENRMPAVHTATTAEPGTAAEIEPEPGTAVAWAADIAAASEPDIEVAQPRTETAEPEGVAAKRHHRLPSVPVNQAVRTADWAVVYNP